MYLPTVSFRVLPSYVLWAYFITLESFVIAKHSLINASALFRNDSHDSILMGLTRALHFVGSLLLFLWLTACEGRALPLPFPFLRLPLVGTSCPRGVIGVVPVPLGLSAAGSPAGPSGASNPYLRSARAPCSSLEPSVPLECLCMLTCNYLPLSSSAMPLGVLVSAAGSILFAISSS